MIKNSTAILVPSVIFKNSRFFFEKPIYFFKKKFERFENSCYFSRILRQTCYNLMKKIAIQTRKKTDVGTFTRAQLAKIGLKKRTYFRGRFCFPYFQYGAK